ncbi:MAG: hypothetical protein NVSMB63_11880 [Sediminibacterium sp.]
MRLFFAVAGCLVFACVSAQQKPPVWGYLRDSATHEPISMASVTNLNTHQTVMTGRYGLFHINLAKNQVLSFAAVGYYFDTIQYTGRQLLQDTLQLHLSPLSRNLGNVTVRARGMSRYELDSMERRTSFLHDIGNYTIPTISQANSGAGIALNLDRFSKHEKRKRKALQFYEANEEEAYINYRFTEQLVRKYTGLKEEALQQFMQQFRPSYTWLRQHLTEEDIKYYINDRLKTSFRH